MRRLDVPVNLSIMDASPQRVAHLRPVKVLDIFDGGGKNYHPDGLFSTEIFGRVGSDERDVRFSFIELRTRILHPLIYQHLVKLKGLYKGIMAGKAYAVWDEKEADFLPSDQINGKTGYYFFMTHWRDIKFKGTGSDIRDMRIELIEKYKNMADVQRVLVLPAGLRDIHIDEMGRPKEGEINEHYRSILSISNAIGLNAGAQTELLDTSRHSLQMAFNRAFDFLYNLLEGKGGFLQGKWGARHVYNGTRNVITGMDTSPAVLGNPNAPGINNTCIGLYQFAKGALPKTQFYVLNGWLKKVFAGTEGNANLINQVSLKREMRKLPVDIVDRWTTTNGIAKVINSLSEPALRLKPIMIDDYYIGLVYAPKNRMVFKIFGDIDELPNEEGFSRDDVHPLTLAELIYLSGYPHWNKLGMYVTRYPVTGVGSIYPSQPYVKTTITGEMRYELGEDWKIIGPDRVALEYPSFEKPIFVDSLIPHPSRLAAMGADFDGDTSSANIVYTDEAVEEVQKYLSKKVAYLDPRGGLKASPGVETVERVLRSITGD